MQLHAAGVTLVNHPLQRVPVGLRRCALLPGEETAPRLQLAGVERVGLRPYLEEVGVDIAALQSVEVSA